MQVQKSYFYIGIYNPIIDEVWPYFNSWDGTYLSEKNRVCSIKKAIEFESPKKAREFFHSWKHKAKWRMELVEFKKWVDAPDPVYAKGDPRSIIKNIHNGEKSSTYATTAIEWFSKIDIKSRMTPQTFQRHRTILLKYNIDIENKPSITLNDLQPAYTVRTEFETTTPQLKIIK